MSELRRDPLNGRWTIISPERSRRSDAFIGKGAEKKRCPFCGTAGGLYEIYKIDGPGGWELKTVPNRYPVLGIEGNLERSGAGVYDRITGIGANEIIIDSPRHGLKTGDYTESELFNLFTAFKARMEDLAKDVRFRYIAAFKNTGDGSEEGAAGHPHAQIVALPVIPPLIEAELEAGNAYYRQKERCLSCDLTDREIKTRSRVVFENYDFVAFCPYASEYPFQVAVYPKKHCCSFAECGQGSLRQLADITKEIYSRLSSLLDSPAVITAVRTAPLKNGRPDVKEALSLVESSFHWHMEIRPVITKERGLGWAAGMTANPVKPEEAALYLREVAVK